MKKFIKSSKFIIGYFSTKLFIQKKDRFSDVPPLWTSWEKQKHKFDPKLYGISH